jgi:hypothetical protein
LEKNAAIAEGSETIWNLVEKLIRDTLQTPGAPGTTAMP